MSRPTRGSALLLAGIAVAVAACAEPGDARGDVLAWDSAGVTITETSIGGRPPPERLTLAEEPDLLIGLEEGEPELLFQRVTDAAPLNDTLLMAVEWVQREVRIFRSDDGRFVTRFGGSGEGPGEFGAIFFARPLGQEEILLGDGGLQRLTWWNWQTGDVRTAPLDETVDGRRSSPMSALRDGTVVGITGTRSFGPGDVGTLIADTMRYYLFEPDGTARTHFHVLPGQLRWGLQVGGMFNFPFVPFSVSPSLAAGDDLIYLGTGTEPRVEVFDRSGTKVREIRWDPGERARVDDSLLGRLREHQVEVGGSNEEQIRVLHRDAPLPEAAPVFQDLFVDSDGRLWVKQYRLPWEAERRWHLFDESDHWVGEVVTEQDLAPRHASGTEVLGVLTDEMGVERVARFSLRPVE
jgi:hypothetical protein